MPKERTPQPEIKYPFDLKQLIGLWRKAMTGDKNTISYLAVEQAMAEVAAHVIHQGGQFNQEQWDVMLPIVEEFVEKSLEL